MSTGTETHGGHAASDEAIVAAVSEASGQNIWACYQCGKCTSDCPFSLTPNLAVRLLQLGDVSSARALATTWECASCYTCQTECPKGVSPARIMKALRNLEPGQLPVLPHRRDRGANGANGASLYAHSSFAITLVPHQGRTFMQRVRARLLAMMPRMLQMGSKFVPVSNWVMHIPGMRLFAHLFFGIHRKRPFPALASQTFPKWFASHAPAGDGHRGRVLLFHDTFMDFNNPWVGTAVTTLLEKAGYKIELTNSGCCGRPAISKGVHDMSEACARNNIPRLYQQVSDGRTYIVGCEPSCLLTLRDEYLHLAPELQDKARVVADKTLLIDEFLAMLEERGELELKFKREAHPRPVLFHGHCHQKAFADARKSLGLLRSAGYDANMVNAACCGMAGAHGYEREHYEPSREAGERALFPTLRSHPDADVVVMGISCRQQIEHFVGRPVKHLTEALLDRCE